MKEWSTTIKPGVVCVIIVALLSTLVIVLADDEVYFPIVRKIPVCTVTPITRCIIPTPVGWSTPTDTLAPATPTDTLAPATPTYTQMPATRTFTPTATPTLTTTVTLTSTTGEQ